MKIITKKKIEAYIQLSVLLIASVSFSYFISGDENPLDELFSKAADAISKPVFGLASASTSTPSACCEKLKDSQDFCLNVDPGRCDPAYKSSPTSCETTSYCKLGTCYDSKEGICMENTPQVTCQSKNGTWDPREAAEIPQCQLSCCVIADQAAFVPLVRCKRLSSFFGVAFDFRRDITNEADCIATAQGQDTGACVFEQDFQKTCKFTTKKDCNAPNGQVEVNSTNQSSLDAVGKKFYKDFLCSAEELGTNCARQASTGCYQGKVYWFDSCGNRENVYSANKDKSWSGGKVAKPESICSPNDGNNKDCGNCEYLLGSRCAVYEKGIIGIGKPSFGDYFCKKTECTDKDGKKYKNGESWCVYDASTGNGTDPVGSRHYRNVCVDGVVKVEACTDFRQQVCIQGQVKTDEGNFKTAACRVNRWQDCANQVKEKDCTNTDMRDCAWLPPITGLLFGGSTNSGSYSNPSSTLSNPTASGGQAFSNPTATTTTATNPTTGNAVAPITGNALFGGDDKKEEEEEKTSTNRKEGVCVPDISPGLRFWEDGEARSICGLATSTCIVTFEVGKLTGRKCIENCECLEENWALQMNQVCSALGDCGADVNFIGKYTGEGYEWKQDGKTKTLSEANVGKVVKAGTSKGSKSSGLNFGTVAGVTAGIGVIGMIAGKGLPAATTSTSMIPNLVGMIPKVGTQLTPNWLASGAFNALLIGGIVWGGAKLLGVNSVKANALGAAATIGLLAGEMAGQMALKAGTKSVESMLINNPAGNPWTIGTAGSDALVGSGTYTQAANGVAGTITNGAGTLTTNMANGELATMTVEGGKVTSILQQSAWAQYAPMINLAVTIGVAILVYLYMNREYETEKVTFTCQPWQAPRGGSDCEKCNDANKPCSEYRCKSLGGSCAIVNKGTAEERCVNINPKDVEPPIITPVNRDLTAGFKYTEVKTSPPGPGFKIVSTGATPCLKAFTPLKFSVDTNEPAQCKIDFNHTTKMDEMQYWVGGNNLFLYNHSEQLVLPGTKDLQNVSGLVFENGKELTLYMRCRDNNGNENPAEYAIRFCTDPSPDNTAPEIKATSITSGGCVANNQDTAKVDFFINEPAECKWSKEDKSFENMNGTMNCATGISQINSLQVYPCSATLTGISKDGTDFYVRCKDQPGKPENERNKNAQSYKFTLKGSNILKIKSVSPNETVYGAIRPAPVELRVETLYGCENSKAMCYYSRTGRDNDFIAFFDTNTDSGINVQMQDLDAGSHTYYIKCVDSGGNVARESVTFNVEIDTNAPVVSRVYYESDMLKVVTVRNSECAYTLNNCDFTFQEGQQMPYPNSTVHVTEWKTDKTYYIKCRDQYKNEPADCSIIVRPYKKF